MRSKRRVRVTNYLQRTGLAIIMACLVPTCAAAVLNDWLDGQVVTQEVVLFKSACDKDDWGCELDVAYQNGWRP